MPGWPGSELARDADRQPPDPTPDVLGRIGKLAFKRQRRNQGVTEIVEIPNRGHSLTIDSGWREVAGQALAFVKRFV